MQMQEFSFFLRSSVYRLSTFVNEMLSACHTVIFSTCFPLILLNSLIVFNYLLRGEPLSIRNVWFLFPAASIAVIKCGYFLLIRRKNPVQFFVGGERDPMAIARGSLDLKPGVALYPNGDSYEGKFYLGKFHGSGVYNFFKQGRYEGRWIGGKCDGYGMERWKQGTQYHGHYRNGLYHGLGVYQFNKSASYAGEWAGGHCNGYGVLRCSDGGCYVGEFECGVKHGLGVYYFSNGDKYAGTYLDGMINGFGVYYYANDNCYEGSWLEGVQHGFGTYALRGGGVKSGEWNYGTLKNSLALSHPEVHRSVQNGRNAAERAIVLPSMEEQLNEVVAAANGAAAAARVAALRAAQYCEEQNKAELLLITQRFNAHVSKFVNMLARYRWGWGFYVTFYIFILF